MLGKKVVRSAQHFASTIGNIMLSVICKKSSNYAAFSIYQNFNFQFADNSLFLQILYIYYVQQLTG